MSLRIPRVRLDTRVGQRDRPREMLLELGIQLGGRFRQVDARFRERPQVVIDRHGAAQVQHLQPEYAREIAVRCGRAGCLRDRAPEQRRRLFVPMAVGQVEGALPQGIDALGLVTRQGARRGEARQAE